MYLTFENPLYLWFLFSIPLVIISHFYFLKKSKSKAIRFANVETIKRIAGENLLTRNIVHLILRIVVLFCLTIAVSGAKFWYMADSNNVNYVIALDSSASMTAEDVKPTRFAAAKSNVNAFVDSLEPNTKLGLICFSGITEILQPMTDSKLEFKLALARAEIASTGGTDMPGAIITATNLLISDDERGRSIILISDGVNTLGAYISNPVMEAVDYAKQHQVIIHTIGIGSNQGPIGYLPEYYNISASYNEDNLRYMSNETGGDYFYVYSTDELVQALSYLGENTSRQYVKINISLGALLIALSALFIEWGLANTIYRRVM